MWATTYNTNDDMILSTMFATDDLTFTTDLDGATSDTTFSCSAGNNAAGPATGNVVHSKSDELTSEVCSQVALLQDANSGLRLPPSWRNLGPERPRGRSLQG
jgi:hypothetical protein